MFRWLCTWNSENILYLVGRVSQIHEKKISVGLFSTFRHPLGIPASSADGGGHKVAYVT